MPDLVKATFDGAANGTDITTLADGTPPLEFGGPITKHPNYATTNLVVYSGDGGVTGTVITNSNAVAFVYFNATPDDGVQEITAVIDIKTLTSAFGLCLRMNTALGLNCYVLRFGTAFSGIRWRRYNNNTQTDIGAGDLAANPGVGQITLRVRVEDNVSGNPVLQAFIDGAQIGADVEDSNANKITNANKGKFGLYRFNGSAEAAATGIHLVSYVAPETATPTDVYNPATEAAIKKSENWFDNAGLLTTVNVGAEGAFRVSGSTLARLRFTVAALGDATRYPRLRYIVFKGGVSQVPVYVQLDSTGLVNIQDAGSSLLASGSTYDVFWEWVSVKIGSTGDRWTNPDASILKWSEVIVEDGATLGAVPASIWPAEFIYGWGDSIFEDAYGNSVGTVTDATVAGQDASRSWFKFYCKAKGKRPVMVAFSGQGYNQNSGGGLGSVPPFKDNWHLHMAGVDRLSAGVFPTQPAEIVIAHGQNGTNDRAHVEEVITEIRAALTDADTPIFIVPPPTGRDAAKLQDGEGDAADSHSHYLATGTYTERENAVDFIHLTNSYGQPRFAADVLSKSIAAEGSEGGGSGSGSGSGGGTIGIGI